MSKIHELVTAEAQAAEEAEALNDDHAPLPEGTQLTRGHNRSKVLQVRLNGDEMEQLEIIAKARDLPVSTVARAFILTALSPTDDAAGVITRIETDLAALKRWVVMSAERLEDMSDRLAIHEREGLTTDYEKLAAELGLDAD